MKWWFYFASVQAFTFRQQHEVKQQDNLLKALTFRAAEPPVCFQTSILATLLAHIYSHIV